MEWKEVDWNWMGNNGMRERESLLCFVPPLCYGYGSDVSLSVPLCGFCSLWPLLLLLLPVAIARRASLARAEIVAVGAS